MILAGLIFLSSAACEPAPGQAPCRDLVATETKLYSQFDEEIIIRDFFQDRRDGFFLDIGGAWAVKSSTTYYLEKHLGWSGIGVDANRGYAKSWKEERPRSKFFAFLVSDHSGTTEKFYKAGPVGSVKKSRTFLGQVIEGEEIEVLTTTINDLLAHHGIESIDFLSMDIEGSEPAALAGFDIGKYRPKLVCIEAPPSINRQLLEYFEANGYERIDRYLAHDPINWYFAPSPPERACIPRDAGAAPG